VALEPALYIQDLVESNPSSLDAFSQADDHILMIKRVLKDTFPLFTTAINMSSNELNNLWAVFRSTTTHFEIGYSGPPPNYTPIFPIAFLGYVDAVSTNKNQYAFFDKTTKMIYKKDGIGALGSIFWSILDNPKMQAMYPGDIFALCDGNPIPANSEMYRLFGTTNTPSFPGRALIMETLGAGEEKILPLTQRTFNTDVTRLNGISDIHSHNHIGGPPPLPTYTHTHKYNLYDGFFYKPSSTLEVGYLAPEKWMDNSQTANYTEVLTLSNPATPIPEDKHSHTLTFINKNTETTPSAIFLNAYMRIN